MQIFGHLINSADIIGIGPMMVKWCTSGIEVHYGTRQFMFDVHTKERSITIQSDPFRPEASGKPEVKEKVQNDMKEWKERYAQARKEIAQLIGEQIEEEAGV